MDRLIKRFDCAKDEDLMLCEHRGVAYQRNMARKIEYNGAYFEHYKSLAGTPIEIALNKGRCSMLERGTSAGAAVIDIGIGSGAFIQAAIAAGFSAKGYDINPEAVAWLKARELYAEDPREFSAVTAWDSIEHMEDPEVLLKRVSNDARLLVALPLFPDLRKVRESKHYKPGEHLYYWTEQGFIDYMALYGFRLLECSTHEVEAGRESIGAFAFKHDLPGYREHIAAYQQIHSAKHYGDSASELYLDLATRIVKARQPKSILDFGCGRSDLSSYFWRDGERRIAKYDPAIPRFSEMPENEQFDLVFCCDVLEHVPMAFIDKILFQVKERGALAFFSISTRLAKARLPDGRNAHVTLLSKAEWLRWIDSTLGQVQELPTERPDELLVLAGPVARETRRRMSFA